GATSALSNTLAGGTWGSSNPGIAAIGVTTGVLYGALPGTSIITYLTPAGCFVTTTAIINPTPVINSSLFTNPTTCVTSDGTITLTGLTAGTTFTVNYTSGTTPE